MPTKVPSAIPPFEAFVYASRAKDFPPGDLPDLVAQSARRNAAHLLTGVVLIGDGRFLQYVEGPPVPLLQLWNRLQHDPRHTNVALLYYAPAPARRFPHWPMERFTARIDTAKLERLAQSPRTLQTDAGLQLVLELLPLPARTRGGRSAGGEGRTLRKR